MPMLLMGMGLPSMRGWMLYGVTRIEKWDVHLGLVRVRIKMSCSYSDGLVVLAPSCEEGLMRKDLSPA